MTSNPRPWRIDTRHDTIVLSGTRTIALFHSPGDAAFTVAAVNAHHQRDELDIVNLLYQLKHQLREGFQNMTSQQDALDADVAQLNKALGEIRGRLDTLNASIVDLQAQVDAGGTVDLTALTAASQALDDVVPDAPAD